MKFPGKLKPWRWGRLRSGACIYNRSGRRFDDDEDDGMDELAFGGAAASDPEKNPKN